MRVRADLLREGDLIAHNNHWEPVFKTVITTSELGKFVNIFGIDIDGEGYLLVSCIAAKTFTTIRDFPTRGNTQ